MDSESGTVARFARAVDQLEACAGFIEEGGGPRLRMAIVLLDSLADNFLFRRLQIHVMRSDEHGFSLFRRRRLNKRDLEALERSFPAKLLFVAEMVRPVGEEADSLPESDVDILRISHRYRNSIYHRDTHNPAVVPVIGRLLFGATCRLFSVAHEANWGLSVRDEEIGRYRDYGVESKGMLWPREAAQKVADKLQQRITVSGEEAVTTLSVDLRTRVDELREMLDYLPLEGAALEQAVVWTEFWHRFGYDATLVRFANRADWWLRRDEPDQQVMRADVNVAQNGYNSRVLSLWKSYSATVSLAEIDRAAELAQTLGGLSDLALALHVYHEVDNRLTDLEDYLGDMVTEYDRQIDLQIDAWKESR